jgi:hypothetical protein
MSKVNTVEYFMEILEKMDKDAEVAIPFIWTKADLEDLYGQPVSDFDWSGIIEAYNTNDFFCEVSINTLVDYAAHELGGYPE